MKQVKPCFKRFYDIIEKYSEHLLSHHAWVVDRVKVADVLEHVDDVDYFMSVVRLFSRSDGPIDLDLMDLINEGFYFLYYSNDKHIYLNNHNESYCLHTGDK